MTFAFADPAADVCGLARVGTSALAVLFAGGRPVAAVAGDDAPGLSAAVQEPDRRWTVRFESDGHGFDLTFDSAGPVAEIEPGEPVADAGGMCADERLCRVNGTVRTGGRTHELRGRGRRSHAWGEPDWDRMDAARTVAAWMDDGSGVVLSAVRPAGASDHEREATWAALLGPGGVLVVDDPRLSTTYDGTGHQRRAGLELWVGEDDPYPRRAAGEVVCGAELDLGPVRLDCAFMRWRMDGRSGAGHYDVLRRA